jgi:hypothetical protein
MNGPGLQRVAGEAAPVLERATRLGFGAKGVVTILVGALALRYALGTGGELTGQGGAIRAVRDEPFGLVLLLVLVAGLAGYALWMFAAAFIDPEGKGTGFSGIAERVAFFVTGIGYAVLAYAALELVLGRAGNEGTGLEELAALLLTPVAGRWLVGLVGAIVMVAGLLQLRLGATAGFRNTLREDLSRVERAATVTAGRFGYLALGVLSLMVGYSLVRVAIEYDPSVARGWDEALSVLSRVGQGGWPLTAAAIGLIFYGIYFVLLVRTKAL